MKLTDDEYEEYIAYMATIELGGNDGADIAELQCFAKAMEQKYELPFEHLISGKKKATHD